MYNLLKSNALLILMVLILPFACTEEKKPPENIIAEDVYIDLMAELQLVESYRLVTPKDSVNVDSLKQKVYGKFGVTEQEFKTSHEYYQEQTDKQQDRITRAIEKLRMEATDLKGKSDSLKN